MEKLEKEKLDFQGKVYKDFCKVWKKFQYADKSNVQLKLDILEEIEQYVWDAVKNPDQFDCSELQLKIICDHFHMNVVHYHKWTVEAFENPPGWKLGLSVKKKYGLA